MIPASWANGEYQQAQHFQISQSTLQLTRTSVRTCQRGTANNTNVSGPVNRGLSQQGHSFISQNGTWQQTYIRQVGNGHPVNNATAQGQVATLQHGHQNSVDNFSTQNISNTMRTNVTYCHQNMPTHVTQMVSSHGKQLQRVQNGNRISNNDQQNMVQRSLHQNVNGTSTVPFLAHQAGITSTSSPSASVQIRPITQSLNYSQSAQQRALPSTPQIRHNFHQLSRNGLVTTNSLPNCPTSNSSYINSRGMAISSVNTNLKSQSAQQVGSLPIPQPNYNLPQLSKNEPVTTNTLPSKENCQNSSRNYVYGTVVGVSSSRTNSNGSQYEANQSAKRLAGTGQYNLRQQSTNSGEITLLKVPNQTHSRSPYGSSRFVSKETKLESHQTMQPVVCSAEICRSNPLILAMLTEQPLAKNTSNMPTLQLSTDTLPQQRFASKNPSITPTAGASGDTLNRDSVELKAQLSPEKEREMLAELEMFIRLYSNDNSIHSSGHTVPKAVAVVPPLSQKNIDTASESTSSIKQCGQSTEVDKSLPEGLKEGSLHLTDNCKTSPKTSDRSRRPSSTPVISSELPQSQNTNQKVVNISDRGPELSVNMEMNRHVVKACPSEVLTQNSAMENSEKPADPKLCAYDLSSIPTVQWTAQNLDNYIDYLQLAEDGKTTPASCSSLKILQMFWGGSVINLRNFFFDRYKNLLTSVFTYLRKHRDTNTVILSEVKDGFIKVLENCHVLEHDEMYENGFPYVSSWLNTNEKLDDIDKEFGFPWFLRTHRMSDSESQQDCTSINTNAEISNEAHKSLSLKELEPADSHKEESDTDKNSSEQCVSPTESSADSSDPDYSFAIQVLPPEEAKIIFEKNNIQLKEDRLPQKTTESCTKGVSSSIVKGSHKTTDVCQMQQICCLTKWMETVMGHNSDLISKCQCKTDPADKHCTEGKLNSAKQAQVEENSDNSVTSNLPEINNTFILNGDFLSTDDTPQACEPSHDSMDSTNSSIIFISENQDQKQVPIQMHNQGEDSELAPIESPGSSEYCTPEEIEKNPEIVTSDESSSEIDSDRMQPELESTDIPEPPMEEEGDTHTHVMAAVLPSTRPSKRKRDMRTAELVLFGSASQGTHDSVGQLPSSAILSHGAPRPPKMLSVDIRPMKPTTSETIRTDDYSVKRWLYEKWKRSLPPPTIRKNKAKMRKKLSVHRASVKRGKMLSPTSTKNWSFNLDVRDKQLRDEKKKGFLSLKKRRKSLLTKPTECESHCVVDPHEDNVLGFNVLPKTFSFKDGSNNNSNTRDDVGEKTLLTEADNQRSSKALKKARGTWYPKPAKMYSPLRPTTGHRASGVFHEFQKRYMEKTQTPTDA